MIIGTYYNPDGSITNLKELDPSLLKVGQKLNSNDVILAGDFNIPNINRNDNKVIEGSSNHSAADYLLGMQQEYGLKQLVTTPTRMMNLLDL